MGFTKTAFCYGRSWRLAPAEWKHLVQDQPHRLWPSRVFMVSGLLPECHSTFPDLRALFLARVSAITRGAKRGWRANRHRPAGLGGQCEEGEGKKNCDG